MSGWWEKGTHLQPFGGTSISFQEQTSYFERTGIRAYAARILAGTDFVATGSNKFFLALPVMQQSVS